MAVMVVMIVIKMTTEIISIEFSELNKWKPADEISAGSVFLKENFNIKFVTNGIEYLMVDSLPEILIIFARFIREDVNYLSEIMLISGSIIELARSGSKVYFKFYDRNSSVRVSVEFSNDDFKKFYYLLLYSFIGIIHRTFSKEVIIKDIEKFRI